MYRSGEQATLKRVGDRESAIAKQPESKRVAPITSLAGTAGGRANWIHPFCHSRHPAVHTYTRSGQIIASAFAAPLVLTSISTALASCAGDSAVPSAPQQAGPTAVEVPSVHHDCSHEGLETDFPKGIRSDARERVSFESTRAFLAYPQVAGVDRISESAKACQLRSRTRADATDMARGWAGFCCLFNIATPAPYYRRDRKS